MFLQLKKQVEVKIAKEKIVLLAGYYFYVGSAFGSGGLRARLSRHLRNKKKIHWHIDQLTSLKETVIKGIMINLRAKNECLLSQIMHSIAELEPITNFGNSDCRANCQSHLYRWIDE